jgi:hypothetical protein
MAGSEAQPKIQQDNLVRAQAEDNTQIFSDRTKQQ